jgi:hypothetical protein
MQKSSAAQLLFIGTVTAMSTMLSAHALGREAAQTRYRACQELPIHVRAQALVVRAVCAASATALGLLARCEIAPHRPVRIEVDGEVLHPLRRKIFGMFDIARETVRIANAQAAAALAVDTPYERLPAADFWRSLIVHEVVHAVLHQNLQADLQSHAAYEYPAYALQLESLPANVREDFLASVQKRSDAFIFNDIVLHFDPYYFAANAYAHFTGSGDGCAHLQAILAGRATFVLMTTH